MTTEYLLEKEVEQVLGALMPSNALVCHLSMHTGLRIGDVLRLQRSQLKPRFWVTESKTGKKKLVGIPEPVRGALHENWVACGKGPWLFPGRDPRQHRTRQAVWKDVKRAAAAYRINQNVAPHSFRKVYAVDLMEKYGDIEKVKRALNHSNEAVTMIYAMAAERLRAKQLRKVYRVGKCR